MMTTQTIPTMNSLSQDERREFVRFVVEETGDADAQDFAPEDLAVQYPSVALTALRFIASSR